MYQVGIIGAGGISERHIKACKDNSKIYIAAIADIKAERVNSLKERFDIQARVYTDFEKMLDEVHLDFVIVNLPHFLHLKAAHSCAEHGCNILMEKPMAMNVDECSTMLDVCSRNHVKLMIGHVIHYYPETILAKRIIQSCELGRLLMINDFRSSEYFTDDRPAWFLDKKQSGGGLMINLGVHSFDRILWTTERKVKEINAFIQEVHPVYGIEGHAQIHMALEGGLPAVMTLYGYRNYYRNETEFYFTGGVLQAVYGDGVWLVSEGNREKVKGHSLDPFTLQINDFISYIEGEISNPVPGEYGMEIIRLIQESYKSLPDRK